MMYNTARGRRILFATLSAAALGLFAACVSTPRPEPAGSAAPASAPPGKMDLSTQTAAPASPPAAASPAEEREFRSEGAANRQARASSPTGAVPRPKAAARQDFAAPPPRSRGEPQKPTSTDKDKKASGAGESMLSGSEDLRPDPLVPALADPPDLRTALQDFQGAAERFASVHACNEGCRAYQSMQRAAARICDLVSNRDPTQRCASARTRVTTAQRDLKERCGDCAN